MRSFNYSTFYTHDDRATKTFEHIMWKYNLSFQFTPEYDGSMGSAGETRAYGVDPPLLAPYGVAWDGVYLGSAAMASEQFAANTLIHENSHYEDGFGYVFLSSLGHDKYFEMGSMEAELRCPQQSTDVIKIFACGSRRERAILDISSTSDIHAIICIQEKTVDIVTYWNRIT